MKKIALAFSGGGFRAAAFCLGGLKYLNRVKLGDELLIDKVKFISSTSGGSMTNIWYTLSKAENKNFQEFYVDFVAVLKDEDVLLKAINELATVKLGKSRPQKSENFINALSLVYDEYLQGKTLGDINNSKHTIPKICINATELSNGLAFRFNSKNANHNGNGVVGNKYIQLVESEKVYDKIKLADIMAASSCFPSGFEPMIFPRDFSTTDINSEQLRKGLKYDENPFTIADSKNTETANYNKLESIATANKETIEFGLMDGGIVDNQAIDGFLKESERGGDNNLYDLVISCDVSSYFVDPYTSPKIKKFSGWKNMAGDVVFLAVKKYARSLFTNPTGTWAKSFSKYLDKFLSLPKEKLLLMAQTRSKSVFMLANDLYLKQIRRMYQAFMFSHHIYKDKFILNAIYDLSVANPKLPTDPLLAPSANMMAKAEKARTMSTTIWFDDTHKKENVLQAIIDTGEFTMCYNLLKHFRGRVANNAEENAMVTQLVTDYKAFKSK
jgi:predicted acylesterase/phospholipase RssA